MGVARRLLNRMIYNYERLMEYRYDKYYLAPII